MTLAVELPGDPEDRVDPALVLVRQIVLGQAHDQGVDLLLGKLLEVVEVGGLALLESGLLEDTVALLDLEGPLLSFLYPRIPGDDLVDAREIPRLNGLHQRIDETL